MRSFFILPAASSVLIAAASQNLVTSALDQIVKLLITDWLVPETETPPVCPVQHPHFCVFVMRPQPITECENWRV